MKTFDAKMLPTRLRRPVLGRMVLILLFPLVVPVHAGIAVLERLPLAFKEMGLILQAIFLPRSKGGAS